MSIFPQTPNYSKSHTKSWKLIENLTVPSYASKWAKPKKLQRIQQQAKRGVEEKTK